MGANHSELESTEPANASVTTESTELANASVTIQSIKDANADSEISAGVLLFDYNKRLDNGHIVLGNQKLYYTNMASWEYALHGFGGKADDRDIYIIVTAMREFIEEVFNIPDDIKYSGLLETFLNKIKQIINKIYKKNNGRNILNDPIITGPTQWSKSIYYNYPINFSILNLILRELSNFIPGLIMKYNEFVDRQGDNQIEDFHTKQMRNYKKATILYDKMPLNVDELVYNRKIIYGRGKVMELGIIPIPRSELKINKYIPHDVNGLKEKIYTNDYLHEISNGDNTYSLKFSATAPSNISQDDTTSQQDDTISQQNADYMLQDKERLKKANEKDKKSIEEKKAKTINTRIEKEAENEAQAQEDSINLFK